MVIKPTMLNMRPLKQGPTSDNGDTGDFLFQTTLGTPELTLLK